MAYSGQIRYVGLPYWNVAKDKLIFTETIFSVVNGLIDTKLSEIAYEVDFTHFGTHLLPWIDEAIDGIEEP